MADGAGALRGPTGLRRPAWPSVMLAACVVVLWPAGVARAQPPAANGVTTAVAVEEAYERAEAAFAAALAQDLGRAPTPDDPAWRAAVDAAQATVAAARAGLTDAADIGAAASLRRALALSARVYGAIDWHSRAFAAWDAFLAEGGEVLGRAHPPAGTPDDLVASFPTDLELAVRALNQLAFARYQAGDPEGARGYYLTLLDLKPEDPEALRWLARIAFEQGDSAVAVGIWQRLVEVAPDDEGARFFLELSRERERYGVAASDAFRLGVRAYEAGSFEEALGAFEGAYAANPDFRDAAVWSGRVALELHRPDVAAPYWEAALAADPGDDRAAWFLELTRAQQRWGVEAANAFYAGQAAYAAGEPEAAAAEFERATAASPEYVDAWVWTARSQQESGRADAAIRSWQEVIRLDPDDERARWFLQSAQQQLSYGLEAGTAFAAGLEAYQAGDADTARERFTAAVRAAPDFTMAWGYLGRLAFQAGDHDTAADAYERALMLEPENDDYAFFAAEARRLAGQE